jgi:hypothetical protein
LAPDLRFRFEDIGFRCEFLEFGVQKMSATILPRALAFNIEDLGFRVWGLRGTVGYSRSCLMVYA